MSSDFISLDDLKTLLIAGLKNETIDDLNCSTVIQQNENSITVCLSFRIESKFIKHKPSDIKFILDKVNFNEIEKHNFLINDVCNVIQPTIDNEQVIRCCVIIANNDGNIIKKITNYADNKDILSIITNNKLAEVVEFNSIDNKYTLDIFKKLLIKKHPTSNYGSDYSLLLYVDYDILFNYLTELNHRIQDISVIPIKNETRGFSTFEINHFNLTLQKSIKKYNIEYFPDYYNKFFKNVNGKFEYYNFQKIEGRYKILHDSIYGTIIERDE